MQRGDRAHRDTGRVGALVAAQHREVSLDRGELANLGVLDPGPEVAEWHFVLGLTGDGARVAPDAATLVEDKTVLHDAGGRSLLARPVRSPCSNTASHISASAACSFWQSTFGSAGKDHLPHVKFAAPLASRARLGDSARVCEPPFGLCGWSALSADQSSP